MAKELTYTSYKARMETEGFIAMEENDFNSMIEDLKIDAEEKESYEKWNTEEIINGRA